MFARNNGAYQEISLETCVQITKSPLPDTGKSQKYRHPLPVTSQKLFHVTREISKLHPPRHPYSEKSKKHPSQVWGVGVRFWTMDMICVVSQGLCVSEMDWSWCTEGIGWCAGSRENLVVVNQLRTDQCIWGKSRSQSVSFSPEMCFSRGDSFEFFSSWYKLSCVFFSFFSFLSFLSFVCVPHCRCLYVIGHCSPVGHEVKRFVSSPDIKLISLNK